MCFFPRFTSVSPTSAKQKSKRQAGERASGRESKKKGSDARPRRVASRECACVRRAVCCLLAPGTVVEAETQHLNGSNMHSRADTQCTVQGSFQPSSLIETSLRPPFVWIVDLSSGVLSESCSTRRCGHRACSCKFNMETKCSDGIRMKAFEISEEKEPRSKSAWHRTSTFRTYSQRTLTQNVGDRCVVSVNGGRHRLMLPSNQGEWRSCCHVHRG